MNFYIGSSLTPGRPAMNFLTLKLPDSSFKLYFESTIDGDDMLFLASFAISTV